MNNTKKIASILILFLGTLLYSSCETIDMDMKEDPNALSVDKADVDFYLNGIQRSFALNMQDYGRTTMEVTRMTNMFGRSYENAYSPATLDIKWSDSYQSVLKNIQLMNVKAAEKGLKRHIGIGQVLEAYTIVNLVDFFGDVPYTEALLGSTNLNAKADTGASIYNAALVLLDKAIVNFSGTSPSTTTFNDFYYNKDWAKWIKLANSIKMKIYIQKRLVDPTAIASFNTIVSTGNFMQTAADDFQFEWNSNVNNPDGRSPLYSDNYLTTGTSE
ncbi:SusD/RagB family nutrient-binding outer membrane lipoprotein, partial [Flavobacterium sp. XS1P32]